MSHALNYSREPRGRSTRSKRLFWLVGVATAVLGMWSLWGRDALERQLELRNIRTVREHAFPPGLVVYSDEPVLRERLRGQPGYRMGQFEPGVVYDENLSRYRVGGAAVIYVGGRTSPTGVG